VNIKFSDVKLRQDTYVPYFTVTFKDDVAVDPGVVKTYDMYGESIINVMVAGYKQALEKELPAKLKELGMIK
jgi:hypothetical protein